VPFLYLSFLIQNSPAEAVLPQRVIPESLHPAEIKQKT